jgi:hypothetical protein
VHVQAAAARPCHRLPAPSLICTWAKNRYKGIDGRTRDCKQTCRHSADRSENEECLPSCLRCNTVAKNLSTTKNWLSWSDIRRNLRSIAPAGNCDSRQRIIKQNAENICLIVVLCLLYAKFTVDYDLPLSPSVHFETLQDKYLDKNWKEMLVIFWKSQSLCRRNKKNTLRLTVKLQSSKRF